MLKYKNIHCARQWKYDIRKLKDMEFIRIYEQVRMMITENSEQQNNQNEETSETKWENY